MFGGIRKIPTTCPHCGFVQQEPAALISTFCRGCGEHYNVAREAQPTAATTRARANPLVARIQQKLQRHVPRVVHCYECGEDHIVSAFASSTQCRSCGAHIDLTDITVTTHASRHVNTRGKLHVERGAFLNNSRTTCGDARVDGRIAGRVLCERLFELGGIGPCRAQVKARRIHIMRGADVRFEYPLYTDEIVIRGAVSADVYCNGRLIITRHGSLTGDIVARSVRVERGGRYTGSVRVARDETIIEPQSPPAIHPVREPSRGPLWTDERLAFC
jgi:cytoskeletal protein CcmA (bactofilin family)